MDKVSIRSACADDAAQIREIYSYYVLNTAISFEYDVPTIDEFKRRIENTLIKYPYIALLKDDKIIGYAYAGPFKTRDAYKYSVEISIYIKNGYSKKGFGKLLLSELEKRLVEMGYKNSNACIAYTDISDEYLNNNSSEFHAHMGYSFVGRFHKCACKFDRWYDMIWMEKLIAEH